MLLKSLVNFAKTRTLLFLGILILSGALLMAAAFTVYRYSKRKPPFDYVNIKHKKITNLNLAGGLIKGMLAYTPPGYDSAADAHYPVIIYLHGGSANGNGSAEELN